MDLTSPVFLLVNQMFTMVYLANNLAWENVQILKYVRPATVSMVTVPVVTVSRAWVWASSLRSA